MRTKQLKQELERLRESVIAIHEKLSVVKEKIEIVSWSAEIEKMAKTVKINELKSTRDAIDRANDEIVNGLNESIEKLEEPIYDYKLDEKTGWITREERQIPVTWPPKEVVEVDVESMLSMYKIGMKSAKEMRDYEQRYGVVFGITSIYELPTTVEAEMKSREPIEAEETYLERSCKDCKHYSDHYDDYCVDSKCKIDVHSMHKTHWETKAQHTCRDCKHYNQTPPDSGIPDYDDYCRNTNCPSLYSVDKKTHWEAKDEN